MDNCPDNQTGAHTLEGDCTECDIEMRNGVVLFYLIQCGLVQFPSDIYAKHKFATHAHNFHHRFKILELNNNLYKADTELTQGRGTLKIIDCFCSEQILFSFFFLRGLEGFFFQYFDFREEDDSGKTPEYMGHRYPHSQKLVFTALEDSFSFLFLSLPSLHGEV